MFKRVLSLLLLLLSAGFLQANVIFPSWIIASRIQALFSWSLIVLCVVIECIFMYLMLKKQASLIKIVLVTILMNAVSAVAGFILMMGADAAFSILAMWIPEKLVQWIKVGNISGGDLLYGAFYFCSVVLINTIIECSIAKLFIRTAPLKRLIVIVATANTLSVGIGLLGSAWYLYHGWPVKV